MSDWYCHTHGIKDCECYEADLVKRIAELEAERDRYLDALHEIYGMACQAMNSDDDMLLYGFAQEARDIALDAAKHRNKRLEE